MFRWKEGKDFLPISAEIHLTNKCNLNCLSCWRKNKNLQYSNELSDQSWLRLVDDLLSLKIKEIYFGGGGEPIIRKDLVFNIIKKIKKNKIKCVMTTNCTLFNESDIKELINLEFDHIQISIDGPDKKTQNLLRGEGVYEKNIQILRLFNKWRKRLKKENPYFSIHTVLSNKNYDKLRDIVNLAIKLGIKEVNVQPLVMQSEYCQKLTLNSIQEKELQKEIKKALILAEKGKIITNFESLLKKEERSIQNEEKIKCFEPWNRITIQNDGIIKTCCNPSKIQESNYSKSLEKIWNCRKFNKLRKKFYRGKLMKECCTHPNKRL